MRVACVASFLVCIALFSSANCWGLGSDDGDVNSLSNFPHEYTMTSKLLSMRHRIKVESESGEEIGSFYSKIVSARDVYVLEDKDGRDLATATKSIISWGAEYTIESDLLSSVFSINERKIRSAVRLGDIFTISKDGDDIATIQKTDILRDVIEITEDGKGVCAVVKKAWFGIRDSWSVSVVENSEVEPWVIGFFTAIVQIEDPSKDDDDDDDDDDNDRDEL